MTIEATGEAIRALEAASKLAGADAKPNRLLGAAYRMGLRLDDAIANTGSRSASTPTTNGPITSWPIYTARGGLRRRDRTLSQTARNHPQTFAVVQRHGAGVSRAGRRGADGGGARSGAIHRRLGGRDHGRRLPANAIGLSLLAQNKLKQAQQAVAAALLVEPRYSWARIAAAEVDLASGKYFEAERNLIAARSYANFPTLYFTLGKLYLAVEDFDGALEQFSKAFDYSPQGRFTARLGGVFDARADNLKELLSREHQAAIFLAEPPTRDETFKIAEALVRFNTSLRAIKAAMNPSSTGETGGGVKDAAENAAEARRGQVEEVERAAADFIEAEGSRRSFRTLSVAERLAHAGVSTGLAVELAEQALGLAQVATEPEGALREYPNYDRSGRLAIFRGRALSAKGWALFKPAKILRQPPPDRIDAGFRLAPEGRRALWRLATVKETQGELKEALDLYIAAYVAGAGSELDRAVIESLYRKINGSLEGLDKRLQTSSDRTRIEPMRRIVTDPAAGSIRVLFRFRLSNTPSLENHSLMTKPDAILRVSLPTETKFREWRSTLIYESRNRRNRRRRFGHQNAAGHVGLSERASADNQ